MASPANAELDAWVLATAPRAVAYAISLLRDRHEAEDVVQECYCRLLARAAIYDLPRDGLKLLLTAVSNACINRKTRKKHAVSLSPVADEPEVAVADRSVAAPDELASGHELESAIGVALAQLPMNQRAALELKSLGHSQQEVGEILGISATNAGVLIHRARQTMARLLAKFLGEADVSK